MYFKIILLYLATLYGVRAFVLPVQKCNLSDSACLKTEFQKAVPIFMSGIKEYDIEVLDVMVMDIVHIDMAGLQFTLKNGRLSGMKTIVIDDVQWNTRRQQFSITYHFTTGSLTGNYLAAGKVLVMPVTGEGDMIFHIDNLLVKMTVPYELVKGSDGKDYVDLRGLEIEHDARENPRFNFTNLFDGNKQLSDRMHSFMNEHWKPLTVVFGKPLAFAAMEIVLKNMQKFFKNVPLSDIAEY